MNTQIETRKGSRVVITHYQRPVYLSRLYVNYGDTATLTHAKHKTRKGRDTWADKVLNK